MSSEETRLFARKNVPDSTETRLFNQFANSLLSQLSNLTLEYRARLDAKEVIKQYHGLWVVKRAFRIGKSDLEMRPMFHFTPKRIEAHICICFVAYKVYKELERTIRQLGIGMSVDKALFYAKTIPTLRFRLPNGETYSERLYTMPQQEQIRPLLED